MNDVIEVWSRSGENLEAIACIWNAESARIVDFAIDFVIGFVIDFVMKIDLGIDFGTK